MNISIKKLDCKKYKSTTKRKKDFYYCQFEFSPKTENYDRFILHQLIEKGTDLAHKVNPDAANNSTEKRNFERILINAIAGLLAEYLWKFFLNLSNIDNLVRETQMTDKAKQIDLQTIKKNQSIEVRSSFPRNGLNFAICDPNYQFDIIGPYSNKYKPNEIQKNFYARTLYPFDFKEFNTRIKKNNFKIYLCGGATWKMIENKSITLQKSFIPEDETTISRLKTKSNFLVIPFAYALDSIELFKEIKKSEI